MKILSVYGMIVVGLMLVPLQLAYAIVPPSTSVETEARAERQRLLIAIHSLQSQERENLVSLEKLKMKAETKAIETSSEVREVRSFGYKVLSVLAAGFVFFGFYGFLTFLRRRFFIDHSKERILR